MSNPQQDWSVIREHPLYKDHKQATLELAIEQQMIIREVLNETQARYTLTLKGAAVWDLEKLKDEFFNNGKRGFHA